MKFHLCQLMVRLPTLLIILLSTHCICEARTPADNYVLHCSGCHMTNGSGSRVNLVPDIRNVIGFFTRTPAGRKYIIQVADVSQAPLADQDLADLVNWTLYEFSKEQLEIDFEPYSESEVEKLRNNRPADLHSTRRNILVSLRAIGIQLPEYVRP